jgi:hypothetical protein
MEFVIIFHVVLKIVIKRMIVRVLVVLLATVAQLMFVWAENLMEIYVHLKLNALVIFVPQI